MSKTPTIDVRSECDGWARYRQHDIHVWREEDDRDWYITVTAPSGGRLYDGYWRDSWNKSMEAAVREALRGSLLSAKGWEC